MFAVGLLILQPLYPALSVTIAPTADILQPSKAVQIHKRGLSCSSLARDKLCNLLEDYNGYHFVGYHGTCSNHEKSIEKQLKIQKTDESINGQLGSRFYVAGSPSVAYKFGVESKI
ncbi:hypothetical protein BKA69DRAFT_118961 [Paraphysoderma sedebokerense]|nr:hypothetical protein BKA69DRAFT_118961 [Paraphysoderma sedebokerense]